MGYKYRARVQNAKPTFFRRRPRWRFQIERHFMDWHDYGEPSRPYLSPMEAKAAANDALDALSAKPKGEYV